MAVKPGLDARYQGIMAFIPPVFKGSIMSELRLNSNVYQTLTQAAQDQRMTPDELQNIRQEMEASGQVEENERQVLDHLNSRTEFSISDGIRQTPIQPQQLTFPEASLPISAFAIGQDPAGNRVRLGNHQGTYLSEREAAQATQKARAFINPPDLAVVQAPNGDYQVYGIEIPGHWRQDGHSFGSYAQVRAAELSAVLPEGSRLVGVMADNRATRFLGRESSPEAYARPADPLPITEVDTPAAVRQARIAELRDSAGQALTRLNAMEQDLGAQQDHRGIFPAMYRVITERGVHELDKFMAQGDLRAAEFEGALLVNFANRYFDAYDAYAQGDMANVPEVWRSAFDSGRNAEATGYPQASVTEVVSLSMVAHIINDLPQTLQDIGYTTATDRQSHLEGVYDSFNQALMDEKANIMGAISQHYGRTDMHILDTIGTGLLSVRPLPMRPNFRQGAKTSSALQSEVFTQMRTLARDNALRLTPAEIRTQSLRISDLVRNLTLGGN